MQPNPAQTHGTNAMKMLHVLEYKKEKLKNKTHVCFFPLQLPSSLPLSKTPLYVSHQCSFLIRPPPPSTAPLSVLLAA